MGDRRSEQREQAVARELRDRAVVAADLLGHELHDFVEEKLRSLRPQTLGNRRRSDHVRHQDGYDAALTGASRHRLKL
jgi:hypothetical protein